MKTFRNYFFEQEGLGDLGQQDLSNDIEKPEQEEMPNTPPGGENFPSESDETSIVRKAMRIIMKAGDKYKNRVFDFLKRMARDIPELQDLVSHLNSEDKPVEKKKLEPNQDLVSTPVADVPSDPGEYH
jgi:hypothetical protein